MARLKLRELNPVGDLNVTGSFNLSGSLYTKLDNPAVFQPTDPNKPSLVVSGALELVQAQIHNQIVSASLVIQNLGSLSDRSSSDTIDLGGFF
jgi:hypothetical protein